VSNTGRWSAIDVTGGTFTSTDATTGIAIGSTLAGSQVLIVRGTGVATAERVQFGATTQDTTGNSMLSINTGGTMYLGSGGMQRGFTGGTTLTTRVELAAGTLG